MLCARILAFGPLLLAAAAAVARASRALPPDGYQVVGGQLGMLYRIDAVSHKLEIKVGGKDFATESPDETLRAKIFADYAELLSPGEPCQIQFKAAGASLNMLQYGALTMKLVERIRDSSPNPCPSGGQFSYSSFDGKAMWHVIMPAAQISYYQRKDTGSLGIRPLIPLHDLQHPDLAQVLEDYKAKVPEGQRVLSLFDSAVQLPEAFAQVLGKLKSIIINADLTKDPALTERCLAVADQVEFRKLLDRMTFKSISIEIEEDKMFNRGKKFQIRCHKPIAVKLDEAIEPWPTVLKQKLSQVAMDVDEGYVVYVDCSTFPQLMPGMLDEIRETLQSSDKFDDIETISISMPSGGGQVNADLVNALVRLPGGKPYLHSNDRRIQSLEQYPAVFIGKFEDSQGFIVDIYAGPEDESQGIAWAQELFDLLRREHFEAHASESFYRGSYTSFRAFYRGEEHPTEQLGAWWQTFQNLVNDYSKDKIELSVPKITYTMIDTALRVEVTSERNGKYTVEETIIAALASHPSASVDLHPR